MKSVPIVMAVVTALGSTVVLADAKLADARKCNECHAVDREVRGPSYQAIAKLYKGTPKAEAQIAEKIRKGGADHWGPNVMPSPEARGVKVSESDAKKLARWILTH